MSKINSLDDLYPVGLVRKGPAPLMVPENGLQDSLNRFYTQDNKLFYKSTGNRASHISVDGKRYAYFGSVGSGIKVRKVSEKEVIALIKAWR